MDDEQVKARIGANIAFYRKQSGLTQAQLAEKLNYSDKAVSKWERGESIPDVLTLMQIADQFQVTVDDLLGDVNALPDNPTTLERAMTQVSEKALRRKANKNIILALSTTLVWFVALFVFVVFSSFDIPNSGLAFFYAIPVNAIVLLSLRSAWHDFRWNKALISAIVWGSLVSIYASIWAFLDFNAWKIFLLGIPGQIAIFLWFRMFKQVKEEKHE
ncbi:MAG: helix-turn-helix transcriptional regulator [Firmicutes bacterium]|nr:helix-turn-helix transcriptional regulator [Bacillota bacterium]MDY6160310.1 helix-turn-helix transcriptional regulator [Candidatus Faecousia sp.]